MELVNILTAKIDASQLCLSTEQCMQQAIKHEQYVRDAIKQNQFIRASSDVEKSENNVTVESSQIQEPTTQTQMESIKMQEPTQVMAKNELTTFKLSEEVAKILDKPFVAGEYVLMKLDGRENKEQYVFVSPETAFKIKGLINQDVKDGYYLLPKKEIANVTNKNSDTKKWYENKWVQIGISAGIVGITHLLYKSNKPNSLSGFPKQKSKPKKKSNLIKLK